MRTTSPRAMKITTPITIVQSPDIDQVPMASLGNTVATMERTSSAQGMASMAVCRTPPKGNENTRGRAASTLRSLEKAGNIGM